MKKVLSAVLTAAMLAASSVNVFAAEYALLDNVLKQNYEQGTEIKTYSWENPNSSLSIKNESGNNYLAYTGEWKGGNYYDIGKISGGVLEISFDFRRNTDGVDGETHISLMRQDKDLTQEALDILKIFPETQGGSSLKNGLGVAQGWGGNIGSYVLGTWYTYKCELDIDKKHITVTVCDKLTGVQVGSKIDKTLQPSSSGYSDWPETVTEFTHLRVFGKGTVDIDNFDFKKVGEVKKNITKQTYENGTNVGDYGWSNNLTYSSIKQEENGNYYLNHDAAWKNTGFVFDPISDGVIQVSFDFRKNRASEAHISLQDKNKGQEKESLDILKVFANGTLGATYPWSSNMGSYTNGVWYSYNCTVDLDTKSINAKIINRDTGVKVGSVNLANIARDNRGWAYWPETAEEFSRLQIVGGNDGEIDIDNLNINRMKKEYTKPTVSAEKVSISRVSGKTEGDWTKVAPAGRVITVDFGTVMDNTNLGNCIYVTAKDSEEKIPASVIKKGDTCILTANEPWAKGVYTLHITAETSNASGITLGESAEFDFTVVDGELTGTTGSIKMGDNIVESFASVEPGSILTLPVQFENSYGAVKNVQLISVYYDENGVMLRLTAENKEVAQETSNVEFSHTVEEVENATNLKFFIWDNLSDMHQITNKAEL